MKTTTEQAIEYKGWLISEETEPWALKFSPNLKVKYSNDGRVYNAESVEEAKREIDELNPEQ